MSTEWAERERRTNKLVRAVAKHLFSQKSIGPDQIYGLCRLTWITKGDDAYIVSTKIPAFGDIFGRDYSASTLKDVADDISTALGLTATKLVQEDTGFTNLYGAYRNTAREWIKENFSSLLPLFKAAYSLKTDEDGLGLVGSIGKLPKVPKANHKRGGMQPEYLVTPAFFALDERMRFPLINGNEGVKKLLTKLGVSNSTLTEKYQRMIGLYGQPGIEDAADLDQRGDDLPQLIGIGGKPPTLKNLEKKPTDGNELPLKDEGDIQSLQEARLIEKKRLHNNLTNKLKECLSRYELREGCDKKAQYDVLVRKYNKKDDLLIEVKSSTEVAHVRMAIGQLFSYWFSLKGEEDHHLAVLLPNKPDTELVCLLEWLGIGILWFSEEELETCSDWLKEVARYI